MELLAWLEASALATWVRESGSLFAYPLIITLHTLGLSMLVGGSAVIDLRLLGVAPALPLPPLEKLFRIMWIGFVVNALSGAALFLADATVKGVQVVFWIKLLCIALGVVTILLIRKRAFGDRARMQAGLVPAGAKRLAIASLVVWAGAITAGRLMAYL
jgi:hypothetical protein